MTSLQSILTRAEDRATHRISEIDHRVAGILAESCQLTDERSQLAKFLEDFRNRDRSVLESLFADDAPTIAVPVEPAPPAPPAIVAEVSTAPVVVEQAAPVAAAEAVPELFIVTKPEARGLKDSDAKLLIVMRAERGADGICRVSMTKIAEMAGVAQKTAAEQCVKRLRTAGIIVPTRDDPTIFHVADKGERVPLTVPSRSQTRPSASEATLDAKVLEAIKKAAVKNGGRALFGSDQLAKLCGTTSFNLSLSIGRLTVANQVQRIESLAGHLTFEVVGKKVSA